MKAILAIATLALVTLVIDEKARQVASDAHDAYGAAVDQARTASDTLTQKIEHSPLVSVALAGMLGYVLSALLPRHS